MTTPEPGPLRALTIKPPWSSAIAFGSKRVENRSWPTQHRGLLAIHAGQQLDWRASDEAWLAAGLTPYRRGRGRRNWEWSVVRGAIVAVAILTDCHDPAKPCGSSQAKGHRDCSPWAMAGQWHWVLDEVVPLRVPVPCAGALRLWAVPADVQAEVIGQVLDKASRTPKEAVHG